MHQNQSTPIKLAALVLSSFPLGDVEAQSSALSDIERGANFSQVESLSEQAFSERSVLGMRTLGRPVTKKFDLKQEVEQESEDLLMRKVLEAFEATIAHTERQKAVIEGQKTTIRNLSLALGGVLVTGLLYVGSQLLKRRLGKAAGPKLVDPKSGSQTDESSNYDVGDKQRLVNPYEPPRV